MHQNDLSAFVCSILEWFEIKNHQSCLIISILFSEEFKVAFITMVKTSSTGICIDCDKSTAGPIAMSKCILQEINDICTNTIARIKLRDGKPTYFDSRIVSSPFWVTDSSVYTILTLLLFRNEADSVIE